MRTPLRTFLISFMLFLVCTSEDCKSNSDPNSPNNNVVCTPKQDDYGFLAVGAPLPNIPFKGNLFSWQYCLEFNTGPNNEIPIITAILNKDWKFYIDIRDKVSCSSPFIFNRVFCANQGVRVSNLSGDNFNLPYTPYEWGYGLRVGMCRSRSLYFGMTAISNCSFCTVNSTSYNRWQFRASAIFDRDDVDYRITGGDLFYINAFEPEASGLSCASQCL